VATRQEYLDIADQALREGDEATAMAAMDEAEKLSSSAPRNLEIPTPENLAISAAENQRLREANKQPEQSTSLVDYPIGAADAAWSAVTAGTTGLLGNIAGTLQQGGREVMSGQYGTNEAADRIAQRAADVGGSATWTPRTEIGRNILSAVGEVAEPFAGLAGMTGQINAATQAARMAPRPEIGDIRIPQTKASQEAAQRIVAGDTGKDLAKSTVIPESIAKGKPRLVADAAAKEAIKQGFDEGIVSAVKQTNPANKSKLLQMAKIAEKAKNDAVFGASNRPADVAGDSLAQRIKTIRNINRDAGQRLDGVAKSLRGQKGNLEAPTENFAKNLDEMGISQNDDGSLNFIGSDVEGIAGAEKVLKQVAARVRKLNADDAYDMHRLKRYIDEQVTYGKSTEGLSGRAERALKNLRADIDASLDSQFPEYNKVNTQYSDTVGALDSFQDAAGTKVNLFGENSEKALGTVSRRLLSNTQSRVNLIDSIKNIDDVAKKYGTKFDDDIMTQVLFADELDKIFGAAAKTSLQGDVGKGVRRGLETATGQRTLSGIGIDAATAAVEKFRGINEENAFKSIKELLKRDLKENTTP
jgi:hypothetical protein